MPRPKYKLPKNRVLALALGLSLFGIFTGGPATGIAAATSVPGCYQQQPIQNNKGKTSNSYQLQDNSVCDGGTNDPSKFCYLAKSPTAPFAKVDCGSIPSSSVIGYRADNTNAAHQCGSGSGAVVTSINFGCKGDACKSASTTDSYCSSDHSAVIDVIFGIIRFLSYGVGFVVVGSIVIAGIQYTTSRGDPKATAAAEGRIKSTVGALLLYIFGYAILNYVIPAGFFNR